MRSRRGIRLKRIKIVQRPSGRRDLYYRHPSGRFIPLPDLPETHPDFVAAYHQAQKADPLPASVAEGTLAHVAVAYKSSVGWKALAPQTRQGRARILDHILRKGRDVPVAEIAPKHIANDISTLAPHAARNRLKVWRAMMKFAKGSGMIDIDPARSVETPTAKTGSFHTWTDDEIEQYRAYWPSGTPQRMALELGLWSAARRDDAVKLGRQHLRGDLLSYTQGKTGATVSIPILPAFAVEMSHLPAGQMLFLQTIHGKPRSAKSFGGWFKSACQRAGLLTRCTFHGLRKARARIMAENGATPSQIGAWTGHRTLSEVAHYSADADRIRLAREAAKLEPKSTLFQKGSKT